MPSPRRLAHLLLLLATLTLTAQAQTAVPVVMLSDIHFDPFHDPAKLPQLRTEPIEDWPAILSAPASATQPVEVQSLQDTCHARALDTAWPLLKQSLTAAHDAEPRPLFVTISGDLLTHEFPCRFKTLTPGATPQNIAGFAAKTVAFVMLQTRQAFPRVPVYGALGNNDSGCADYRETPADTFLKTASATLVPAADAQNTGFTPEGDYSVPLPAPMQHTRLIVLQDIFEAHQFATCSGTAERDPEKAQIDWLRNQLASARTHNEHVWVMAHIPPGVDVYTSFRRYILQPTLMCNATPQPFLADTTVPDSLLDYADIIPLALFGHTHMDEIRILQRAVAYSANEVPSSSTSSARPDPPATTPSSPPERSGVERSAVHPARAEGTSEPNAIPAKLVPSISPYAGNHPAFLVAYVDPRTAILKDWRTFISPGPQGSTPPWTEAYRYSRTYHLPDFSAASALKLANTLSADKTGQSPESTAFREHFYPGDIGLYALGLAQIWPAYACSVREDRPSAVHNCICKALPTKKDQSSQ